MLVLWLMVIICVLSLCLIGFAKGITVPKWGEVFIGIVEKSDELWDAIEDWLNDKMEEVTEWNLSQKKTRCKH